MKLQHEQIKHLGTISQWLQIKTRLHIYKHVHKSSSQPPCHHCWDYLLVEIWMVSTENSLSFSHTHTNTHVHIHTHTHTHTHTYTHAHTHTHSQCYQIHMHPFQLPTCVHMQMYMHMQNTHLTHKYIWNELTVSVERQQYKLGLCVKLTGSQSDSAVNCCHYSLWVGGSLSQTKSFPCWK